MRSTEQVQTPAPRRSPSHPPAPAAAPASASARRRGRPSVRTPPQCESQSQSLATETYQPELRSISLCIPPLIPQSVATESTLQRAASQSVATERTLQRAASQSVATESIHSRGAGKDRHSLFGEDPLFVNAAAMDFRLQAHSPALTQIGFGACAALSPFPRVISSYKAEESILRDRAVELQRCGTARLGGVEGRFDFIGVVLRDIERYRET